MHTKLEYKITITERTLIIEREIEGEVFSVSYELEMVEKPLEDLLKDFEDTILYGRK